MKMTSDCIQIFKAFEIFNNCKKKSKIESLTLNETAVIDAINGIIFLLLSFPELPAFLPHKMLEEYEIMILQSVRIGGIVVKEGHKH